MRTVVTGGAGFIGSHLCDALLARDHEVLCVDSLVGCGGTTRNVEHLLNHPRFVLVPADLLQWLQDADLRGVDAVFHLAASKNVVCLDDPERDLEVNAGATLRLARAAARDRVRKLVHSSTGSVFGESALRHGDATPTRPVSYYGVSKLAAESYVRAIGDMTGLDTTILRYYHVVGPRQESADGVGGVVPIFARRALAGEPLVVNGDGVQTRSFTAVADVVSANLLALEHPATRGMSYTCASGVRVSIGELAAFVLEETGSPAGIVHDAPRVGDIRRFDVTGAALEELGLRFATDWRSLVRGVIASLTPDTVR